MMIATAAIKPPIIPALFVAEIQTVRILAGVYVNVVKKVRK